MNIICGIPINFNLPSAFKKTMTIFFMEKIPITINEFLEKFRSGERDFSNIILQSADFTNVDLSNSNFSDASFSNSNFSGSNLSEVNFSGANLSRCTFKGCILKNTNFEKANLEWTIFTGAIFENTNMRSANLMWAHLCKSDLMRANIKDAIINWACLADSKLTIDQMAEIPSGAMETIKFSYDVSQPGGKTTYGPGGKPSLAAYGAGRLTGGYLGKAEEPQEDLEAKLEKEAAYGKSPDQAAFGYGVIRPQENVQVDLKKLRTMK